MIPRQIRVLGSIGFAFFAVSLGFAQASLGASPVLVLSGGGSPAGNHHSQYLQTQALTEGLRGMLGSARVEVLFGAGNRTDQPPFLADVHKMVREGELAIDVMLAGQIEGNSEASRAQVKQFLEGWKGQASSEAADTFFLFVSDHGQNNVEIDDPEYLNNCIDTWAFDWKKKEMRSWNDRCLSREDLQAWLPGPERARNVVFAMSQCFSGGFHSLSVKVEPRINRVVADPRICGFTATAEDVTASGCTPMADGPGYAGYERFFTKQMIGRDFITGEPTGAGPRRSLKEAHRAAILEDATVDIPFSTSDFYLQKWSALISSESKVTLSGHGVPTRQLRAGLESGSSIARTGYPDALNPVRYPWLAHELDARRALLLQTVALLKGHWASIEEYAAGATLSELNQEIRFRKGQMEKLEHEAEPLFQEQGAIKRSVFLDRWVSDLSSGRVPSLSPEERDLEIKKFAPFEMDKANEGFKRSYFLRQDLSFLYLSDPQAASIEAGALAKRDGAFRRWAASLTDEASRSAVARLREIQQIFDHGDEEFERLETEYRYLRRIYSQRAQLGVLWVLASLGDIATQELDAFGSLLNCESTELK